MFACVILAYDWNSAFAFNEKHSSLCTVVLFTVILTVSNLLQHSNLDKDKVLQSKEFGEDGMNSHSQLPLKNQHYINNCHQQ